MNALELTLEQMPEIFSSNEFSRKAKINGITQQRIQNGIIIDFLLNHKNVKRFSTKRTWCKVLKIAAKKTDDSQNISNLDLDAAIAIVKSHGLRVSKPITEWQEL